MFGWEFPPYRAGGLATATLGLVKGLVRRGVDVTLVVPFAAGAAPLERLRLVSARDFPVREARIRVHSPLLPYDGEDAWQTVLDPRPSGGDDPSVYGWNLLAEVERLAGVAADIARRVPHDLIDTHDWMTYQAGMRARRVSGRPLVAHIHATEFDRSGDGADADIASRERRGLVAADAVISNSNALRRQVVERYGIDASKVSVVHWGVEREESGWRRESASPLPSGASVVLFLGRVTRQKGPDHFVEMASRIHPHVPDAHFVIAGTGDLLPRLIERVAELGLSHRVHFAGGLGREEVDRAFKMASVCVMPSVSEPFGLVALESLRRGTPCIVPKESGVAEVVQNAFKIDFWDIDELTDKVVAILRHSELASELAERGQRELEASRFSLTEAARRTEQVYRRTISSHRRV